LEYFKVAPFGFTNSPAHMQRFMDGKLREMKATVHDHAVKEVARAPVVASPPTFHLRTRIPFHLGNYAIELWGFTTSFFFSVLLP
jgi:tRNA/tmRNA/rRNA uracil-C5-methylase (TrmA/RlmC/RlmD family)